MQDINEVFSQILRATRAKRGSNGNGHLGHCPAHDDKTPSLSIGVGQEGRILLHCHAGCTLAAILRALSLDCKDLFEKERKPIYVFDVSYDYRDEGGKLLFQTIRYRLPNPEIFPEARRKKFKQRAPEPGGWRWSLKGVRRVLYRLPELLAAPASTVFIVEGEKDADRLRAEGLTATCNPLGAGNWLDEYNESLRGRDVVIIPDNDEPGRAHASDVARRLAPLARTVRTLYLRGLPDKGDVSDWLDKGHDAGELCAMSLAPETEVSMPPGDFDPALNGHAAPEALESIRITDVKIQDVEWLWDKRIPMGLITILQGIEGVGKSTLLAAIVAAVTSGAGLPDMNVSTPANVLWLSAEDDLGMMLAPRLVSAGADTDRVYAIDFPFTLNDTGFDLLRRNADGRKPRMIIIDPIFAYTTGDPSQGQNARSITNRLKIIAQVYECALILVRHVGKSKGFGDPRAAGLYSIEWQAAARSVLLAGADPDLPQKRALTQTKNNLSEMAEAIEYSIKPDPLSPSKARFFWGGKSDLTPHRILEAIATDDETLLREEATRFLKEILEDGAKQSKDIYSEAKSNGISERTLERAKARLKIKSWKIGQSGPWFWGLPDSF